MKREFIVDKVEVKIDERLNIVPLAYKGRLGHKVNESFMNHTFSPLTDKVLFWANVELEYCGG